MGGPLGFNYAVPLTPMGTTGSNVTINNFNGGGTPVTGGIFGAPMVCQAPNNNMDTMFQMQAFQTLQSINNNDRPHPQRHHHRHQGHGCEGHHGRRSSGSKNMLREVAEYAHPIKGPIKAIKGLFSGKLFG